MNEYKNVYRKTNKRFNVSNGKNLPSKNVQNEEEECLLVLLLCYFSLSVSNIGCSWCNI
jgi:hypothetical protein